ncbi:NrfD/PsrC family molybdoenzyme membrane anchor subunit [Modestobacter sp. VKM Ac-2985]|uniref:NrfD/PsrC family molybdoenzyme membrane anchor subunit n=1 Tax=Modestobacter sp. VKM Ac-2985 TaxID=3004139 RepID=UPI0022AB717A|nr:NrfD/PsrC family molybdoenzyme membrane anchor subunit [Modestobacter sp. VKM Ac-2985]MCZ2836002.1 polysulfide reductase NrfD [Modestobacter sp. VKM Ac-2985]
MTEGLATPGAGWRRADGPPAQAREKKRRKGGRRGGGRDGDPTVDEAEFTSYYGRPIIKPPVWKTPDVPLYLFLGGAAGTSAVLGAIADVTGRPALTRAAHYTAGGGALASVVWLIHDLGRPARFLHMLRVIKPTSPLSVGSYILAPFSALTAATAGLQLLEAFPKLQVLGLTRIAGWFPGLRKTVGGVSAVFGGPMTTYTAVLLANTAVPSWHEPYKELPFVFAGSGMAAGGGICMAFTPVAEAGPARKMAVAGAAVELVAMHKVEHDHGIVGEPYQLGKAGTMMKAAKACTATGAGLTVVAGRTRVGAAVSGALLAAGSLLTRFGVFEAGMASARDPKYTVVPQRARMAAREEQKRQDEASTITR